MPNSLAGLLSLFLLTALVGGFLADAEARRAARRREEPPPAKLPKRRSVEERRAALSRPPRRVRTTAVRPRMPDIDETNDDETDDSKTDNAQTDAPQEMPPARLTTQIVALVGILASGVALFLGCAAMSYVYDSVVDGDRRSRPVAGELFIAALERGDAAEVTRLWRGGAMPSYDLTDCLDINRKTKHARTSVRNPTTIETRVDYETACAAGPHQERLNRIYVEGHATFVYYIGHTPR